MNRLLTFGAVVVIAFAGPLSAQAFFHPAPPSHGYTNVVTGQVDSRGYVEHGSGFSARRIGVGRYEIEFDGSVLPSGCAVMIVGSTRSQRWDPFVSSVRQRGECGRVFEVTLWDPNQPSSHDHSFQFIAAPEQR